MSKQMILGCTLSPADIDRISEKIEGYLTGLKVEKRSRLLIRLSIEELLLRWQANLGQEACCTLKMGSRLGRPCLDIEAPGPACDPTQSGVDEEALEELGARLLSRIDLYPTYSYTEGKNHIALRLKKLRSDPLPRLLLSLALAVAAGLLGQWLPQAFLATATEKVIVPICDTFLGALDTFASPLVFLAVAWGICGMGDAATLGRIGARMLLRFVLVALAFMAFSAVVACLFLGIPVLTRQAAGSGQIWDVFYMLLDVIPENIVSPFLEGNYMQIIFIAVCLGAALLVLKRHVPILPSLLEQLNTAMNYLMELVTGLAPLFVFFVVVQMFWSDSLSLILKAWAPILIFFLVVTPILVFVLLRLWVKMKASPWVILKKCAETVVVALTTGSPTASFGVARHCCEYRLGISRNLTSFGLPLALVFYAPATAIYFLTSCFYFASLYAVEVSLAWIVMAILLSLILTIATPPVPCGMLFCYTIIFSHLGIPSEALAVALALDMIFDFLATPLDMLLLELELTRQGSSANLLNLALLRKRDAA